MNLSIKKPLSIKAFWVKILREGEEPFFYLAPDIVGSVNNAYPAKNKKIFVIDFNTTDDHNMKLNVPYGNYAKYASQCDNKENIAHSFLMKFLDGSHPFEQEKDGVLGEMVDEFGDLFGDNDDVPANIRGNPGQDNTKNTDSARTQSTAQYTRLVSPLGYGGVVW